VSESLALFYEDFGVNIKNVDDVDAMIRSSVNCFIASIFQNSKPNTIPPVP
jgi:hypothetical protein